MYYFTIILYEFLYIFASLQWMKNFFKVKGLFYAVFFYFELKKDSKNPFMYSLDVNTVYFVNYKLNDKDTEIYYW